MSFGFVYIWRDRKHKRYYIGAHWGTENDGYICSSSWMMNAYNRRKEDFKRRILKRIYTDKKDMFLEEQKYLNMVKDEELGKKYYNLNKTWQHWSSDEDRTLSVKEKIRKKIIYLYQNDTDYKKKYFAGIKKRKTASKESYIARGKKIKETLAIKFPLENKKTYMKVNSEEYRKVLSEKSKELWKRPGYKERVGGKISESLKGRIPSEDTKRIWSQQRKGRKYWNNGVKRVLRKDCPGEGWQRGMGNF